MRLLHVSEGNQTNQNAFSAHTYVHFGDAPQCCVSVVNPFSIFAAKLIHDRKSNNDYVLTFIISNLRIRKNNSLSKNVVESLVLFKTERSTATPAFFTPDML